MVSLMPSSLAAAWPRLVFDANPDAVLQAGEIADRDSLAGPQTRQDGHLIRAARTQFYRAPLARRVVYDVHHGDRTRHLNGIGRQTQARHRLGISCARGA